MESLNEMLKNELNGNKILLISFKSIEYREGQKNLLGYSSGAFNKTCYVTVNDPYESVKGKLVEGEVSRFFFIDCVTPDVKTSKPEGGVVFVSSPHALTEISIAITNAMEKEKIDHLIFDSLSTLLIYEKPLTILKFVHSMVLKFREANLNASFVIMKEDVSVEMKKDLTMFVDKIVEI